jgi:cytochrome c553
MAAAAKTHAGLCAPCHDQPYTGVERPAWNLFEQANRLEPAEFLARMLVGVRGDRVTAVENPFSDRELADLIALYRAGEAAAETGRDRQPPE